MKNKRLNLYTLDMKYVRNLSKADDKVFSISPQENKENRPFVGIVIVCSGKKYCIPLSSPKEKHIKMKNDIDFSKIKDKSGSLVGVLNFNNMIPVDESVIYQININYSRADSQKDKAYKELLNNQLDWCNENIEIIISKANKLYKMVTETPEKNRNLTRRCCDFKKLEDVLNRYLEKNSIENESSDQIVTTKIFKRRGR